MQRMEAFFSIAVIPWLFELKLRFLLAGRNLNAYRINKLALLLKTRQYAIQCVCCPWQLMHQDVAAWMELFRYVFKKCFCFLGLILYHGPIQRANGSGHVQKSVFLGRFKAYISACTVRRPEKDRCLAGDILDYFLYRYDLFFLTSASGLFFSTMWSQLWLPIGCPRSW